MPPSVQTPSLKIAQPELYYGEVSQERKVVSESRERTFDYDVADLGRLREVLRTMAHQLCESLTAHARQGRTIGIKVRLDDFSTVTRARTLPVPTSDADTVASVALALLEEYAPKRPVRLLGVRVAGLMPASEQTGRATNDVDSQLAFPV